MKGSIACSWTRIRERAQQSCPALPNTAPGAAAAAASRSASANTTLADLPPSSSVTRLIVAAAAAAIERPTSVEPVKAILATSGCSTSRCPQVRPGPTTTFTTPSGRPASGASSAKRSARQRRQLGRLQHDRVARRERRPELPGGDREREVPRRDQADHADRLAHREGLPAARPGSCRRAAARARRRSSGRCLAPSPSRRGRRRSPCPRCAPRARPAPRRGPPRSRRSRAGCAPASAGSSARQAGSAARAAGDRRVDLVDARARDFGEHRLGGGLEHCQRGAQRSARPRSAVRQQLRSRPSALPLRGLGDRRQRLFDVELVDRADRALEGVLRRDEVPDRDAGHHADRDQRGVVDRVPAEPAFPGHAFG